MAKSLVNETENHLYFNATKQNAEKRKREQKKSEKIDRLIRRFDNIPCDEIERWVDEDFDEMDAQLTQSREFYDSLSGIDNVAIKATGTKWYNFYQLWGKVIKPIHRNCNENNITTILIIRANDPVIYRLSTPGGKEIGILSQAVSKGYVLSLMKTHSGQVLG